MLRIQELPGWNLQTKIGYPHDVFRSFPPWVKGSADMKRQRRMRNTQENNSCRLHTQLIRVKSCNNF
jgi:hypothetical protein